MADSDSKTAKPKILLLDDDPDVLDLYQETLLQLPSEPEVHITTSGARAMAMLETEPFNLLISDLKMPKMDGLQVLAIVRRKYPQVRTIVLTGVTDEQMRSRAYAMGIDLYLEKPGNGQELSFFMDCVESLLGKEMAGGFRGVQSKSLVDLVQLECLTGSSSVLKINNGVLEGRIWIQNGEVIDAATGDEQGEDAFKRILAWKTGNFEILPIEMERPRRIHTSYQGLLLDTAQAIDEASAGPEEQSAPPENLSDTQYFRKSALGRMQGVEFALRISDDSSIKPRVWGLENDAESLAAWVRGTSDKFQKLGERLEFGTLQQINAKSPQRLLHVALHGNDHYALGMIGSPSKDEIETNVKEVLERWAS